jgi:hypothetical protein
MRQFYAYQVEALILFWFGGGGGGGTVIWVKEFKPSILVTKMIMTNV